MNIVLNGFNYQQNLKGIKNRNQIYCYFGKKDENFDTFESNMDIAKQIIDLRVNALMREPFFDGEDFITAFSNSDASVGLVYGSSIALVITIIFYLCTRVLSFKECMNALPEGFKSMVPAILILVFAWTLKSMTDSLGAGEYVAGLVENVADNGFIMGILPAFVFLIGAFLAFATGTSWGTFGLLIPIVVKVFTADMGNELMIISISACMAGAVCGDHCSPISDTTIMASAGAGCEHIHHVSTQLPYTLTAAGVSLVGYLFAGFVKSWLICLPLAIILMVLVMYLLKKRA